ncbi:HNH endonuclease [filamentous cyanobacterium LEGE 11480]|uniref:HNH endonuclease n=1 Tax=Romeriopsis navalis LEGE 11480 TaxID=2777977 RepID=A0A928VNF0_9CYAN|nr:HNH endonuclease [Romeriopsis navalis]MBE9031746.1 HNH endonuclease [Romeriopsis navalis LEGE 11480]
MSISSDLREQVRQRAQCACEFCGTTEINIGNQLTIDHFQPQSKGGSDDLDNLIYACIACNQYKQDYWPSNKMAKKLWNPRKETANQHLIEQTDGQLTALTPTGEFTIARLRLNRHQLVKARQQRHQQQQTQLLLKNYQDLTQLLTQTNHQITNLAQAQQTLLEEQRQLLRILLRRLK